MKRALYLLLMAWIALQSGLVQAHMVKENLHQLSHTAHAVLAADESVTDAEQDESCAMVVCSCTVGALDSSTPLCWAPLSCLPPSTVLPLKTAHAVNDIERPKWPPTTSGVASI